MNAISPRTVNVFHDSRSEIRLRRCLYIRLFVYDVTSKHVANKWVIRCTINLPIVNMVMHCYKTTLCTANDHIMIILHNGWELYSWEMSHSPKHFDEITSLFSASCPFGKLSVRQNVRSAKRPFGKTSVGKTSVGKMSVRHSVFRQSAFRKNVRVPIPKILNFECT
jgi:hypothetical protein